MSKPLVRRVETSTGHYYVNDKDQPIPGVTTILKALPKEALDKWKIKKAVNLALEGETGWKDYDPNKDGNFTDWLCKAGDRESLTAAGIGTKAHDFAEKHMIGEDPDFAALPKKVQKHATCYLDFVADYQPEPVLVEKVLTYIDPKSNQPLYCGTMDLVAKLTAANLDRMPNDWIDEQTWLCDYKASSSQARPSHALQAAAYRYATHWIDDDGQLQEMVPVDHGAVILLNGGSGNSCYRMYKLDTSKVVFYVFKALLTITNFTKIEDRVILGEM